ncbi:MBL fold metallo-hydrolase [Leifsonia sp. NPDC056824]|uniref:MBL fold metallo-hydrolase n=1 Tax=Leifsonia sp. NPDC056824 TaxID=3345953 RepID=UPI0036C1A472
MRLTILGTASHYPTPASPCSGYLLEHGAASIWIDAGPGTLAELQRHRSPADLDAVWISHAHADHTADLLPLFYALAFGDLPARPPLRVLGPPDLRARLVGFLGAHAADDLDRVFAFESLADRPGQQVGDLDLAWESIEHDVPAWALRARADDASLLFTGDATPSRGLTAFAHGCDLLLAEAGADEPDGSHLTPEDAGALAADACAGRLLLTHLALGLHPAEAVRRASTRFDGPVAAARPGALVSVAPVSVAVPTVEG